MKFTVAVLITFISFQSAFASQFNINCTAPTGFAGESMSVKGSVKGSYKVAGNLDIQIGSLYFKKVQVVGVVLEGNALNLMSVRNPELTAIYLNLTSKNVSSVEINGKQFPLNCAK
jgi:hypothetical protein